MRLAVSALACWLSTSLAAVAFDTSAKAAFVVDQTSGAVLLEKDADRAVPPASMSKLMTLNMLFEALRDGRVDLNTNFSVSQRATEIGGSTMFLRQGERVRVEDLIRGIIVQSGNDASVAVAEGLAGSEVAFAALMTERAQELGMTNSSFANSTGWPHPAQRMSARDLVFLADRLITEFPEYYTYFAETSYTWDGVTQDNRNPLLNLGIGADGLKTGHTNEAGYGLVGSARQGKRRIIFMITGLDSKAARAQESEAIANWAFRQFVTRELFSSGEDITTAKVWMGEEDEVALSSPNDITVVLPYNLKGDVALNLEYNGPIEAPIERNDQIAELVVSADGISDMRFPLYAAEDVDRGGILTRMHASAQLLSMDFLGRNYFDF